jgi:hypothetical protein
MVLSSAEESETVRVVFDLSGYCSSGERELMEYTEVRGRSGKTYRLKYTMAALGYFERQTNIRLMGMDNLSDLWLDDMAWLLAAGMRHEKPDADMESGYQLLDDVNLKDLQEQLESGLARDLGYDMEPTDDEQELTTEGTAPKNVRGRGSRRKNQQRASA